MNTLKMFGKIVLFIIRWGIIILPIISRNEWPSGFMFPIAVFFIWVAWYFYFKN